MLILVVHKLVLVRVSRVIFFKYLTDLIYRGMRTGVFRQPVRHHKPEGIMSENGRLHRAIRRIHQRVFYHADDPYRFLVEVDCYQLINRIFQTDAPDHRFIHYHIQRVAFPVAGKIVPPGKGHPQSLKIVVRHPYRANVHIFVARIFARPFLQHKMTVNLCRRRG